MTLKDILISGKLTISEGGGGGGGISVDDIAQNLAPSGDIVLGSGVTEIKDHAFQGKPITSVKGVSVTKIEPNALNDTQITSITDADFPALGVDTQYNVILRLPTTCKSIKLSGQKIALASGSYALRECKGLVTAEFPNAAYDVGVSFNSLGGFAFYSCSALTMADCGYVRSIAANAFGNSTNFSTLILRYPSLVTLANENAFGGTKFKSGGAGGTIYIPKALYDHLGDGTALDYKAANKWSTVNGYGTITWAQIEGSPYEL